MNTSAARPALRARTVAAAGSWEPTSAVDRVCLDFDRRHRRRFVLQTDLGAELLLDLPHAVRLRDGDGLVLDEGGVVAVAARSEELAEITAPNPATLVRVAWHLGNRHLPVQFDGNRLRIRRDHVIEEMVFQLGGCITAVEAAFDPEPGAYAGGGHHHAGDGETDSGH